MAQGEHGGGNNNVNKKAKGNAAAVQAPVGRSAIFSRNVKSPGGAHIVGGVPSPVEVTNRPSRRG